MSGIHFASKVSKFSFVSLRIFRILQLFTGNLVAFEFSRQYQGGYFSSLNKDHKNGAMDDRQDAAGTSLVRRLTRQESVGSTSDRKASSNLDRQVLGQFLGID